MVAGNGAGGRSSLVGALGYPQWARSPAHTQRLLAGAYAARRGRRWKCVCQVRNGGPYGQEMGTGSSSFNTPLESLQTRYPISSAASPPTLTIPDRLQLPRRGGSARFEKKMLPSPSWSGRTPCGLRTPQSWRTWAVRCSRRRRKRTIRSCAPKHSNAFRKGCRLLKPNDPGAAVRSRAGGPKNLRVYRSARRLGGISTAGRNAAPGHGKPVSTWTR